MNLEEATKLVNEMKKSMKPVNWNDPDLVGKKIICKTNKQIYLVKYVLKLKDHAILEDDAGFEYHLSTDLGRVNIWYYYEEPEENKGVADSYKYICAIPVETKSKEEIIKLFGRKKPKLLAPALCKFSKGLFTTENLFGSEQEAKDKTGDCFVSWPAIPNKDGFYEVSDDLP